MQVYTSGRPPWYDASGAIKEPLIIGVAGGSASGKTTVCQMIIDSLNVKWVVLLSQDSFYKGLTPEQRANVIEYNFDHPNAFDIDLLVDTIKDLKVGKLVKVPVYDFKIHGRLPHSKTVYGADVIILEGIMALYWKELRDLMDLKVFVDTDDDIRLARRLRRDIATRGRDFQGVIAQYNKFVKPAFDDYVQPSKKFADIIIPRGSDNTVAIDLITQHIRTKLIERGSLFKSHVVTIPKDAPLPSQVYLVESSHQLTAMHTILRDRTTDRSDFVFYSDRLVSVILEEALALLPYEEKVIQTPTAAPYKGYGFGHKICAVSILRAGGVMETPLRTICKGIRIGKLLIQSDKFKKPQLFYTKLPKDISQRYVLLLDPMTASGASAQMAIRVLLDHQVPEERIIFITVIAALRGLHFLSYLFPKITIVTSAVDLELSSQGYILPGIGMKKPLCFCFCS
eukprot:TRINITY_DN3885_c0_g1_i5.p1 TRINITY_DN3885_c0_g1~~TRINITY_DN3885_c0_g1_i5.p1  ORF type:complete len:454 (-),score=71.24 TRINITY_DN3885_c0_g1_i5:231-1592(-)